MNFFRVIDKDNDDDDDDYDDELFCCVVNLKKNWSESCLPLGTMIRSSCLLTP